MAQDPIAMQPPLEGNTHAASSGGGSLDPGQVQVHPKYRSYEESLPDDVRPYLKKQLDWDNDGVDKDLSEIADEMIEWEEKKISVHLRMTPREVHDIKREYSERPLLERRKVLGDWKMKNGLNATYGCLLDAFLNAGHNICAEVLCRALKKRSREPSRCTSLCPIETQGTQPEDTTSLDSDTLEDLKQLLDVELKNITKLYASYVRCICESLKAKGESLADFRTYLLALSAFNHTEKNRTLLSTHRSELENATDINKIFNILIEEYASFLNYDIFEIIADEYKIIDDEKEELKYPEHLKQYLERHDVAEFVEINPLLKKYTACSTKLVLKIDIESTTKLAKLEKLRTAFANIIGVKRAALQLLDVQHGCIVVTYLIPTPVADLIFHKDTIYTKEQEEQIQNLSVSWLECNGRKFDFIAHSDNMAMHTREQTPEKQLQCASSALHIESQKQLEVNLIKAAKENNLVVLERLLRMTLDPSCREDDEYGWSGLHWACNLGYAEVVDYLLHYGADVDAQDPEGWTGLILASRQGNLRIVMKLLDKGADIHKATNTLWNSLMWTAQKGCAEVTRFLLQRGAIATRDEFGYTPLHLSSQDGHLDVVKALVEHDPEMDMDQYANNGWSAVMLATKNGHEDIVKYLVEHGSNPHYKKKDGVNALHIAAFKGRNKIVRYLCLTERMVVDAQDKDGVTPLMFAIKGRWLDVVRTLVENGRADVNIREFTFQWTAVFFAVEGLDYGILDYLLRSRRVNVMHVDELGNSIVDLARNIYPDVLQYLSDSEYHQETLQETMTTPKEVTMDRYKVMLDRIGSGVGVTITDPVEVSVRAA